MKTVKDYLNELPDGYRELALVNFDQELCDKQLGQNEPSDMEDAVVYMCDWSGTLQGFEFWNAVASYCYDPELYELPPLPEDTVFGKTPKRDPNAEDRNALRGWFVGCLCEKKEEDGKTGVVEGITGWQLYCNFGGHKNWYAPKELYNLTKGQ